MEDTTIQRTARQKGVFWPAVGKYALSAVKTISKSLFTWSWCKSLLYWLIVSGGTMAELAFLIGSIWMSLNATVHPFILMFLSEEQTHYLSFLATSAYVALPELIVSLAVIVTIGHIRLYVYNRRNWPELIWSVLYGLPAIFFACISAYTIGESVANVDFTMPEPFIVARALAGFLFAFTSLLYWQLGKPQEVERLRKKDEERSALTREKDAKISELAAESTRKLGELERITGAKIADLEKENRRLTALITQQNQDLDRQKKEHSELVNALHESSRSALQAYSEECKNWLMSGVKTVFADDIVRFTGHSKRKVNNAIAAGNLQVSPRNKSLILVSSLVEWLEQNPPSARSEERDTGPIPLYPNAVNE